MAAARKDMEPERDETIEAMAIRLLKIPGVKAYEKVVSSGHLRVKERIEFR